MRLTIISILGLHIHQSPDTESQLLIGQTAASVHHMVLSLRTQSAFFTTQAGGARDGTTNHPHCTTAS